MTDTPSKPKRRLWRWLVVSLALFTVAVTSWWYLPRGDVRFVGMWALVDGQNQSPSQILVLKRNGLGTIVDVGAPSGVTFPWRVEGGWLVLGNESSSVLFPAIQWLSGVLQYLSPHQLAFGDGEEQLRIRMVTTERIDLIYGDGQPTFLRRLHE